MLEKSLQQIYHINIEEDDPWLNLIVWRHKITNKKALQINKKHHLKSSNSDNNENGLLM